MNDKLENLKNTDEWWSDPWWLEERMLENIHLSKAEVESSIEYLKTIFTRDWFKNYTGEQVANVLLRNTQFVQGIFSIENLISLSTHLKALENISTIHTVIKNLKSDYESDSANMELELGYVFHKEGYNLEFPIPKSKKNKTPDVIVERNGEKLAIECKKLKISKFEGWINQVLMNASTKVYSIAEVGGFGVIYEFSEKIIDKLHLLYKKGCSVELATQSLIVDINESIVRVTKKNQDWVYIINENIGEGYFSKEIRRGNCYVRTPEIPNHFKFNRLFSNGIKNAISQLVNLNCPGIAAIHVKEIPNYEVISDKLNNIFTSEVDNYDNIIGVMVFPWQNMFERSQPCFVVNKNANFDIENSSIFDVIKKYHDPVWM